MLAAGLVCDSCNNYFGRKLEHAVLDSPCFKNFRARQYLASRAGNPLMAEALARTSGAFFKAGFSPLDMSVQFNTHSVDGKVSIQQAITRATRGTLPVWRKLAAQSKKSWPSLAIRPQSKSAFIRRRLTEFASPIPASESWSRGKMATKVSHFPTLWRKVGLFLSLSL